MPALRPASLVRALVALAFGTVLLGALAPAHATKCPNVHIILDRSGSMTTTMGTGTRWSAARDSISGLLDLVEPARAAQVGLSYFPNMGCDAATPVLPAYGSKAAIASALSTLSPTGSTPSGTAVRTAAALPALQDPTRPQYILLMTDGGPGCGGEPDSASGTAGEITKARTAAAPIYTFVLGIGTLSGSEQTSLTLMADAGGRADATAIKYYPATSVSQLQDSLMRIAFRIQGETAGCSDAVPVDMGMATDLSIPLDDMGSPVDMRGMADLAIPPRDMGMPSDLRDSTDLRFDPPDLSVPPADMLMSLPDLSMPPDLRGMPADMRMSPMDLTDPTGTDDQGTAMPDGGSPGDRLAIEWIAPRELPHGKSGQAVIRGSGFATASPGPSVYLQNGAELAELKNVLIEDRQTIRVVVPAELAVGTYDVIVRNPDGAQARLPGGLTITDTAMASGCTCTVVPGRTGGAPAPAGLLLLGGALLGWRRSRRGMRVRAA